MATQNQDRQDGRDGARQAEDRSAGAKPRARRASVSAARIAEVNKLSLMPLAPDRLVAIQSAGNLATTQAVITTLREAFGGGDPALDVKACRSMFQVAQIVGDRRRWPGAYALCRPDDP